MPSKHISDIHTALLEAHRKGVEYAIDLSIRTGIPLVVEENGKITELKPQFKYIRVPIKANKSKRPSRNEMK
jgi:hypothetical protein